MFMGPTWGPSGADRTQVGPMWSPWTLLSGHDVIFANRVDLTRLGIKCLRCGVKYTPIILQTFWVLLNHWGRMTHIWVSELTIIGSNDGLSAGRRQAIILINAKILSIVLSGTNFNEILIEIRRFSFTKNAFDNIVCKVAVIWSLVLSVWIGANQVTHILQDPFPATGALMWLSQWQWTLMYMGQWVIPIHQEKMI